MDYQADLERMIPTIDVAFVGKLLGDVFGVQSPVYLPTWWKGRDYQVEAYSGVKTDILSNQPDDYTIALNDDIVDDDSPVRFGNKTFGYFWLSGGKNLPNYNQYSGKLEKRNYSRFLMPLATIVEFNRDKEVIKTPTIGSGGTVKEIYGFDDWNITINGIILPDAERKGIEKTVEGQKEILQHFFEIAGSLDVDGQLFYNRNITRIVMEKLTFSPIQGKPNMMPFTIQACSDVDFLLTDI